MEARQEPAAPRAVRVCRICVSLIQSRAAVEPCGHEFCHACIQPQAAPDGAGTCPVCQGPIGAIRLLQGQDSRAEVAPRRRRRLHPFVVRWRQRQEQERREQEQQEQAAPGNRRRRRLSDGDRAPSPVPRQRARRDLQQLGGNGPAQGPWVPRTMDELLSGGDNVRIPVLPPPAP